MNTTNQARQELRIGPEELKARLESGEAVTVIDARNGTDWESSPFKARGAIRFHSGFYLQPPSWPRDRLTVVY